jgi:hypothetical protein
VLVAERSSAKAPGLLPPRIPNPAAKDSLADGGGSVAFARAGRRKFLLRAAVP